MPNALQTPMHLLARAEMGDVDVSGANPYMQAIRDTIAAGGCNASRAIFVGACLGAALGAEGLPAEWKAKCDRAAEAEALATRLAALRPE